jgi:hypothetical protein
VTNEKPVNTEVENLLASHEEAVLKNLVRKGNYTQQKPDSIPHHSAGRPDVHHNIHHNEEDMDTIPLEYLIPR